MQIEWLLSPLAQCIYLACGLIACLALFLSVKLEIAAVRRSFHQSRESAPHGAATPGAELAALRGEIGSSEPTFSNGQGLNPTLRMRAVGMQNHGESTDAIAAALRVPRNEIELLLKIQKLAIH
jgi:hypothetical protein